jgi:hypothetical protein
VVLLPKACFALKVECITIVRHYIPLTPHPR